MYTKSKVRCGGILLLLFILCILGWSWRPSNAKIKTQLGEELGVNLTQARVKSYKDTHGGFLGDGDTLVVLSLPEEAFTPGESWRALPASETVELILENLFRDEQGERRVPKNATGWYWVEDRQAEGQNRQDDSMILKRVSINCTLAVYDAGTETLYYYRIDT